VVADSIRRHTTAVVPIRVVANGIDLENLPASSESAAAVRRDLGLSETALVVGTVAVFRSQKRLDVWLQVAARILETLPGTRFMLVGDGPLRDELERRAVELGLDGKVVFVGLQEDVRPFLAAMDLFLMTSEFEGLPLALLEAMASRVPVVATPAGGIPEVICDGDHGRLAPVGNVDALVEASLDLLADEDLRVRMGNAGRNRVQAEFSIDRMAHELNALYGDVLESAT
jgi:glycosyltransferase involved in cell wall biosynthesis